MHPKIPRAILAATVSCNKIIAVRVLGMSHSMTHKSPTSLQSSSGKKNKFYNLKIYCSMKFIQFMCLRCGKIPQWFIDNELMDSKNLQDSFRVELMIIIIFQNLQVRWSGTEKFWFILEKFLFSHLLSFLNEHFQLREVFSTSISHLDHLRLRFVQKQLKQLRGYRKDTNEIFFYSNWYILARQLISVR